MDIKQLKRNFNELYGDGDALCFFSPSRINIIGEHIDYNGGKVMPAAIELGTYGVVRVRDDEFVYLASEDMELKVKVDLNDFTYNKKDQWANYPKGVMHFMKEAGYKIGGMDILIKGNIPNGAGLSSSASLELLIAIIINDLFNNSEIQMIELVKVSQQAENDFVGVKCGIMDQFAIGMGKENKAVLLDTNSLEYEYIDMDLKDNKIVIMNTNKRRELSDSKYNERRAECDVALLELKRYMDINNLCDLTIDEYEKVKENIECVIIQARVEHVVYENDRVLKASKALREGNIAEIGEILKASHNSLKNLYEVTGKELDSIVNAANNAEGCLGARMTGAGFGGCAIALVNNNYIDSFIEDVKRTYKEETGLEGEFYITGIGGGTRQL